ncbi:hypothetical protein GCM10027169_14620 [Gordonia jinhuaensis]|uniref:YhhN-like protein n=1 Tax=Gordonia jinhuaensis TaxID=1517702 RepID=A0A916WQ23_9ACTN|nr:lysoplasmalogenase family protein [Gordonia jinhuaensis]GGB23665.1 hypothetical protein GCM10011489_09950 [Gordonia jinhuaensis]
MSHDRQLTPRWAPQIDAVFVASTLAVCLGGALHRRRLVAAAKPLALTAVIARSVPDIARNAPLDRALLTGAAVFSLAGDYLMYREEFADDAPHRRPATAKDSTPRGKDDWMRLGALAFGCAHLSYLGLFGRRGGRLSSRRILPRLAVMGEPGLLVAAARPALTPVLGPYGAVLSAMSAMAADPASAGECSSSGAAATRLRVGGMLFVISDDLLINRRHLLSGRRRAVTEAVVLATYFGAQRLLLPTAAGAGVRRRPARTASHPR